MNALRVLTPTLRTHTETVVVTVAVQPAAALTLLLYQLYANERLGCQFDESVRVQVYGCIGGRTK